jgi:predicted small integral membrane protein
MNPAHVLVWIKALVVTGFAVYLSLFVLNNLTDQTTNSGAIVRMMSMRELKEDPDDLGRGVVWRAVDSPVVHRLALYAVVLVQAVTAVLFWRAATLLVAAGLGGYSAGPVRAAVAAADLAMLPFTALWLAMLVVGLWFSYWVKMGPAAQGHLNLFGTALLGVLVLNL